MNEGIMYPWFSKGVRAHCIRLPYPFRKPWDTWLFAHGFCLGVWDFVWSEEKNTPMEFREGICPTPMDFEEVGIPLWNSVGV